VQRSIREALAESDPIRADSSSGDQDNRGVYTTTHIAIPKRRDQTSVEL
jgi:hypothetical protein